MLKGDHTMGVTLGEFPLTYDACENTVASGKLSLVAANILFYVN